MFLIWSGCQSKLSIIRRCYKGTQESAERVPNTQRWDNLNKIRVELDGNLKYIITVNGSLVKTKDRRKDIERTKCSYRRILNNWWDLYFLVEGAEHSPCPIPLQMAPLSAHKWLPSEEHNMRTQNTLTMEKPTSVKSRPGTSDQSHQYRQVIL